MTKQALPITLGVLLATSFAGQAQAQVNAGVKLEAKAGVDVNAAKSAQAKLEARKKAAAAAKTKAAQARVKSEAQANKTAELRARIKAPKIAPPTANIRANVNANANANANKNAKLAAQTRGVHAAAADPNVRAKLNANANAAFKVPPPEVRMELYGEGYAKLSPEEKLRVRTERRAAHWAAFKAKHQAKVKVERPKMLAPTFRAEFRLNAQRMAKLQRIRFLAREKKQVKLVAKADALMKKENKRHSSKLATLFEGDANTKVDVKARGAVNANAKAKTNANANSAVKNKEGK